MASTKKASTGKKVTTKKEAIVKKPIVSKKQRKEIVKKVKKTNESVVVFIGTTAGKVQKLVQVHGPKAVDATVEVAGKTAGGIQAAAKATAKESNRLYKKFNAARKKAARA